MKKSQKGFAHLEVLLLIVIVGIILFTFWYVWHASSQANKSLKSGDDYSNSINVKKKATEQSSTTPIKSSAGSVTKVSPAPAPAPFVSSAPVYETPAPTIVNNYYIIQDWNVRVKYTTTIKVIYAHDTHDSKHRAVFFSSSEIESKNKACKAEYYPAGYIVRYKFDENVYGSDGKDTKLTAKVYVSKLTTDADKKAHPYKVVGDYYFFYHGPAAKCSDLKDIQSLQDQSTAAVKAFFDSLEASIAATAQ
jgi:type II secretory pathway pseudopilin PulG